jgi:hypothetical protein
MTRNLSLSRGAVRPRTKLSIVISATLIAVLTTLGAFSSAVVGSASRAPNRPAGPSAAARDGVLQDFVPSAGDTCGTATVINPAALPFSEESTTVGAGNDLSPSASCVAGLGPDVVYRFTPAATDVYTIGATPTGAGAPSFDLSLYVVTDCISVGGSCLAGANARGIGDGEFVTPTLSAGTAYSIVVDSPNTSSQGAFHFSLKRGTPANDGCAAPVVIDPTRLPLTISGSTFGASNDSNPGASCNNLKAQSSAGGDVVYQFTSNDTQNYDITVTPIGNFDVSVFSTTNCLSVSGCRGADVNGAGEPETLRRNMALGSTFFIIVDGFGGDSGDFTLTMVPTIPRTPEAPTNLVATAASSTEIDLSWQDNSTNEAGFRIERSLDGAVFTEITQTLANVTSFHDSGLTPDTTFFYRVFAFNNFGNSAPSNIAAATTPPPPVPQFPVLVVSPESIDFGSVRATQSAERTITLSNAGAVNLVISSIIDPAGPFAIINKPSLPLTLANGASVELTLRFTPLTAGTFNGTFTINSNDPLRPQVSVALLGVGTGVPVADLRLTPDAFVFPGGSSVQPATIQNAGEADLIVSSFQFPRPPFSVTGLPPLPIVLRPGESFQFSVNFSPAAPGVFTSQMIIVNNDPDFLLLPVILRGTSTPQNELLKLRVPTQFTAIIGASNTMNAIAVNGTNSNITLSATSLPPGGVFTDRGNGRGDLVFNPAGPRGTTQVSFTARDSAGAVKTLVSIITIVPTGERETVQLSLTAPETASNPPTNFLAVDTKITPMSLGVQTDGFSPQVAAGLVGYALYRANQSGQAFSLGNIVAVIPASQSSANDSVALPPGTSFLSSPAFYVATALYATGVESSVSNQTSTAPRMVGLEYKKKSIRFQRASSNVETGAVLLFDGTETFTLQASGDLIVVDKNALSTPGNKKVRELIKGGTHTVQVRNPHGQTSVVSNISK